MSERTVPGGGKLPQPSRRRYPVSLGEVLLVAALLVVYVLLAFVFHRMSEAAFSEADAEGGGGGCAAQVAPTIGPRLR